MRRKRHHVDGYQGFVDLMTSLFALLVLYLVVQSTVGVGKATSCIECKNGDTGDTGGTGYTGGTGDTGGTGGTTGGENCKEARSAGTTTICLPGMEVIKIDSDLLFGTNSARLNNDAAAKIEDQIFDRIKERCAIAASIEIGGHTDRQGEEKLMLNLELSQKRALSVAEVLLKKASGALSDPTYACFREKMMTVGYGATSPEQPYSRSAILDVPKNRRVEIKIRDQIKQGS